MKKIAAEIILTILFCFSLILQTEAQTQQKRGAESRLDEQRKSTLLYRSGLNKDPDRMMRDFLLRQIEKKRTDWIQNYEKIKTDEQIRDRQKEYQQYFWKQLGKLWTKTPLNPQSTGTIEIDGCRIEKIIFQSIPGFYVTGNLYLPDLTKYKPPYHAVLSLMGHNIEGKAAGRGVLFCMSAARNGLAVFAIDPIDQGERFQYLDKNGKPVLTCCPAHNLTGAGSILLGRNTASYEIWDMIRALDYLDSRTDLVHGKYGAAGASGGGTQTAYIMALDDRIKAAAPACYLCGMFGKLLDKMGPQDAEQNIFGQLAFGFDHADFSIMRAPKPVLFCTASKDMFDIEDAWTTFRFVKRIYSRMSLAENADLVETDFHHQYSTQLREATVRWMLRHLAGRDEIIFEPEKPNVPVEKDLLCLPEPGIMSLPNARTTYDLNRELSKELKKKRKELWRSMTSETVSALIGKTAGIRSWAGLPSAAPVGKDRKDQKECLLETEAEIYLPIRSNIPDLTAKNSDSMKEVKRITLFISDQGRFSKKADSLFEEKEKWIVAPDLRGWGETQAVNDQYYRHEWFGPDGSDYYLAYLLGRSYVGMRTEDLLATVKFLKKRFGQKIKIDLTAEGRASTVALHAAAFAPDLFDSVSLDDRNMTTWTELIEKSPVPIRLTDCIHGVLNYYDLDDLYDYVLKTGKLIR